MNDALRQELSRFLERERVPASEREVLRERLIQELAAVLGLSVEALRIPSQVVPHVVVAALIFDIQLHQADVNKAVALLTAYRRA